MSVAPHFLQELESDLKTRRFRTIIYNNDHTPMDTVVMAIMRATNCDAEEASIEMWEAHTFGQADVHFAPQPECQKVAQVISAFGIKAEVKPEWAEE